ncbi:MAG: phosphatidylserine/phosphatidylglycerophosphate/cardiolipin synthase family protein [Patescibacteria group bacterium]
MKNYKFHTISSRAWDAMLATIKRAKKSIYWECYIFSDDTDEHDFFNVLKEKARMGVKVKLVLDSLGSFWLERKAINDLKEAGVEVLFYNRFLPWWNPQRFKHWWFNRNHKKLLIIDEQVAFIGGVNVAKHFTNWIDLQVELRGAIVRYLIRSFVVSYELAGGEEEIKYKSVFKENKVRVFHHRPATEKGILKKYYKKSLCSAKKHIVLATPYFIPQAWLVKGLHRAWRRGVKIEIILPVKADYWVATFANYVLASLVYKPGIDFYFSKSMVHAKAMLIDDREAMVGSQNIDAHSFDFNMEGGVVFERKDMLRSLRAILNQWKKGSQRLIFDNGNKKWYQRLAAAIVLFLRPVL